jgi:DNA-binding NtrC family response regulator
LGKSEIKQEDTSITGYELRSNASILLVDDDENIVDIANKMLTLKGYSVVATTKPSEAIDLVIETPSKFNLVISDVVMPAMSGPQLINKLLKANPDLKFILMSGFTDDVLKNLNVESSSINFLHKPFGLEQLDLKVQQVFP